MRILMLNNEFPPLGGGTGTVNHALLQRFARVPGLEIDLITSALGKREEEEQFAERIRIFKVPVNNHNLHHSTNRELLTYAARALPCALKRHRLKTPLADAHGSMWSRDRKKAGGNRRNRRIDRRKRLSHIDGEGFAL